MPTPNLGYIDATAVTDSVVEDVHTDKTLDSSCTLPWWHNMERPYSRENTACSGK